MIAHIPETVLRKISPRRSIFKELCFETKHGIIFLWSLPMTYALFSWLMSFLSAETSSVFLVCVVWHLVFNICFIISKTSMVSKTIIENTWDTQKVFTSFQEQCPLYLSSQKKVSIFKNARFCKNKKTNVNLLQL